MLGQALRYSHLISVALCLTCVVGAHECIQPRKIRDWARQEAVHELSSECCCAWLKNLQLPIEGLHHEHVPAPCPSKGTAGHVVRCEVLAFYT